MTEPNGPDSLVLRHLRAFDAKLDRFAEKLDDLATRVSGIEGVLGLLVTQTAALNARIDRFERRLDRIERRLNLVEEPQQ